MQFDGQMSADAAGNAALYSVLGGVKRRGKMVFNRPLRIRAVQYNAAARTVTIHLARAFKGPLQVSVRAGMMVAGGPAAPDVLTRLVR